MKWSVFPLYTESNGYDVLLFIYFWHLNWGNESVLHSSISVLKCCLSSFSVLTSWMSASILFRSCLAHLIVKSVGVNSIFSLLKRCRYLLLIKSRWCIYMHTVRRRFVRSAFSFLNCLNRGDVCESFQSLFELQIVFEHLTQSLAAVLVHLYSSGPYGFS